jgi:hypothetical protein
MGADNTPNISTVDFTACTPATSDQRTRQSTGVELPGYAGFSSHNCPRRVYNTGVRLDTRSFSHAPCGPFRQYWFQLLFLRELSNRSHAPRGTDASRVVDFLARPFAEPTLFRSAAAYASATRHRRSPANFGPLADEP